MRQFENVPMWMKSKAVFKKTSSLNTSDNDVTSDMNSINPDSYRDRCVTHLYVQSNAEQNKRNPELVEGSNLK